MGDIAAKIAGKRLNEIMIPGAHDAGSYAITRRSEAAPRAGLLMLSAAAVDAPQVEAWGRAQSVDLAEQFRRGIRYFDLRIIEKPGGEFWLHHSFFSTPLLPALHALRALIRQPEAAREIVILDIPLWPGDVRDHEALASILWDHFGGYLPDSQDTPSLGPGSKVQEFWDAGRTVIVLYQDAAGNAPKSSHFLWDRDSNLRSKWLQQQSWAGLERALKAELAARPAGKLWVAQAMLTPDAATIGASLLLPFGFRAPESLFDLAADTNPKVTDLIYEIATRRLAVQRPNIVIADFVVDVGEIAEMCVRINEHH